MEIYDESELSAIEIERQNNIIANYEFMKSCGLPVKPLVYVKREKPKIEDLYDYVSEESNDDDNDDEWGAKPKPPPKIVPDFSRKVKNPRKFLENKRKKGEQVFKKKVKTSVSASKEKKARSLKKKRFRETSTITSREGASTITSREETSTMASREGTSTIISREESRYPKRKTCRKYYREEEVPDDDHYIFCEECGEFFYGDCPTHGPLMPYADNETNDESLPEGLKVQESTIPNAGLGVFATQSFDVGVRFGPYKGKKICPYVPKDEVDTSYMWEIMKDGRVVYYIDGKVEKYSNWMRFINCSRTEEEQNLVAFQYHGEIYYRVYKPMLAGDELLVWYGEEYAEELGIATKKNDAIEENSANEGNAVTNPQLPTTKHKTALQQNRTGERFFCRFCDLCFSEEHYVISHMKRCKQRPPVILPNSSTVAKSTNVNKSNKKHKCTYCDYASKKLDHLKRHIRTHTNEKPFKCTQCDYAAAQSTDLKTHIRTHTNEKPFKCTQCDYAAAQSINLKTHMRTHTNEKPFKCTHCDYAAAQSINLKTHMRTHTNEKPFKCTQCDYAAARASDLKTHIRTHTNEKPFKCTHCDYAAAQSTDLKTHMRTHTNEKPFKCTQCDYAAAQSINLKTHMRTHTNEKPFKCTHCDYAAAQSINLKTHMRTYTNEKPFKCTQCDYAAADASNLIKHIRTHTNEKPFKCTQCDYATAQSLI